ncbi:YciI family protein [Vineibacter terrae]|uniref:YciI family protein n=1 Tax=Vineibacter terrae TaxID=2586908 RepID=A0A5C8PW99_9HYPH|nr:YciI family protein [Vineibacter terrae]TXL82139.1 YciI family protein [Vineibacter terrae]
MLYAILCYNAEVMTSALPKAQDDAMMAELTRVQAGLRAQGKLGPVARLMPTTAAATLRAGSEPAMMDGPFAETKEQLLGFYVVDCASHAEAVAIARQLEAPRSAAGLTSGALEIRPIATFQPG